MQKKKQTEEKKESGGMTAYIGSFFWSAKADQNQDLSNESQSDPNASDIDSNEFVAEDAQIEEASSLIYEEFNNSNLSRNADQIINMRRND